MKPPVSFEEALLIARAIIEDASARSNTIQDTDALFAHFDHLITQQSAAASRGSASALVDPAGAREAEKLLAKAEELRRLGAQERGLLGTVLTESPHGILVSDKNGKLIVQNRAAERIWAGSATTEGVEGWGQYRAFHPDGRAYAPSDWSMARCLSQNVTVEAEEVHFQRFDGTHGTLLGSCAPLRAPDGTLLGAVGIFADITDFKLVEQLKDRWVVLAGDVLQAPLDILKERISRASAAVARGLAVNTPEMLQVMGRQVERLQSLVNDMLDVSRAQAGNLFVDAVPIALGPLVTRVATALVRASPAHQLQLQVDEVQVLADPARAEQILGSLLNNALQYSPGGGLIRVRVTAQEREALIEIEDQGRGFEPEQATRLFEPFFWLSHEERRPGSLGLGLYLSRELVERMKGRIRAFSEGPGKGARFWFTLPRPPA